MGSKTVGRKIKGKKELRDDQKNSGGETGSVWKRRHRFRPKEVLNHMGIRRTTLKEGGGRREERE